MTGGPPSRLEVQNLRSAVAGPFDLRLARGECVAVTGASGSGKSLLLRMVADLDPNSGTARLDGRDRATIPAPVWRRQVVYVPAESGWWDERVAPHFPDAARAAAMADALGLRAGVFDAPVARLSTGERQRLALIRGLCLDSPVLLLDEPTGALDDASTAAVETVLRARLDAGTAMVLVTHLPAQAGRLAHRRLVMRERRLVSA